MRQETSAENGADTLTSQQLAQAEMDLRVAVDSGYANNVEVPIQLQSLFNQLNAEFPKDKNGLVMNQRIADILTRPVYAGYVEAPSWGISLRKGLHEGLISFQTFQQIQDRLKAPAKAPARKDLNIDFPLRGAVVCADCATPLTACWSKGKQSSYPYYSHFR